MAKIPSGLFSQAMSTAEADDADAPQEHAPAQVEEQSQESTERTVPEVHSDPTTPAPAQDMRAYTAKVIRTLDSYRQMLQKYSDRSQEPLIVAGILGIDNAEAASEADMVMAIMDADDGLYSTLSGIVAAKGYEDTDRVFYLMERDDAAMSDMSSMLASVLGQDEMTATGRVERIKYVHEAVESLSDYQLSFLSSALHLMQASKEDSEHPASV